MRAALAVIPLAALAQGCALYDGLAGASCDAEPFYQPVNLSVPDNNPTGVSSSVSAGAGGAVDGVSIYVDTEHAYPSELNYQLSHNGFSVVFDGDGDHELSDFDGMGAEGTWTLTVWDDVAADAGYWYYWEIAICTSGGATR